MYSHNLEYFNAKHCMFLQYLQYRRDFLYLVFWMKSVQNLKSFLKSALLSSVYSSLYLFKKEVEKRSKYYGH
jgi:hypothetical protein